jgi:hypothetical protein
MNSRILLTSLAALLGAVHYASASITVDFGDYADNTAFLGDFTVYRAPSNTTVDFQWANVAGVGGNGVAQLSVAGTGGSSGSTTTGWGGAMDTSMLSKAAFDLNATTGTITVSSLFQYRQDNGGGTALTFAQIGLSGNATMGFNGLDNAQFLTARINRTAADTFTLQYQTKASASGTSTATGSNVTSLALTAGNWYLLSMSFTKGSGTTVSGAISLDNYGVSGTSLVGTVGSSNMTDVDIGSLFNDSTTYLGARSLAGSSFIGFDSISAVPEPATFALLAGALALGLVMWRRRR